MSDQDAKLPHARTLRDTLLRHEPVDQGAAVMVRTADALHRLERLAEAMEKVAAEGERQLAVVRGRL